MSLAHLGDPYGTVTNGGMTILDTELPQVLQIHPRTFRKALELLLKHKRVIRDSEGRLAVPRMIHDAEMLEQYTLWGKEGWEERQARAKGGLNPPLKEGVKAEQSRGEENKKPPTPLQGEAAAGSLDGYPLTMDIYTRHPALQILHSEPNLRGITLEVYLTAIQRRSDFMNPLEAAKETISVAALESTIRRPGKFLDLCFSRYETDNIVNITNAKARYDDREKIEKEMIIFVCENWRANPAMVDRARSDFSREYGERFINQCEQTAEKIVTGLLPVPDWMDPKLVDGKPQEPAASSAA